MQRQNASRNLLEELNAAAGTTEAAGTQYDRYMAQVRMGLRLPVEEEEERPIQAIVLDTEQPTLAQSLKRPRINLFIADPVAAKKPRYEISVEGIFFWSLLPREIQKLIMDYVDWTTIIYIRLADKKLSDILTQCYEGDRFFRQELGMKLWNYRTYSSFYRIIHVKKD